MKFSFIGFIIILLAASSCEKESQSDFLANTIYFNSFESESDIAGWEGVDINSIVEEAPSTGGSKSLMVSGGCVIPHAYYTIEPMVEDCDVVLRCWGKNLSNGSGISLGNEDWSESVTISVSEETWNYYISEDTLHCSKGEKLNLQLISGGFIPSSMLVDMIEIVLVVR